MPQQHLGAARWLCFCRVPCASYAAPLPSIVQRERPDLAVTVLAMAVAGAAAAMGVVVAAGEEVEEEAVEAEKVVAEAAGNRPRRGSWRTLGR